MDEVIKLLEQIAELGLTHKWVPLLAVIVGLLIRISKSDPLVARIPFNVPPQARAWVAVGLGIAGGVLDKLVAGGSLATAIVGGLLAALTAISGHQLFIEGLRGGRELGEKKSATGGGGGAMFPPAAMLVLLALGLYGCGAGKIVCPILDVASELCPLIAVRLPDGTTEMVPAKDIQGVAMGARAMRLSGLAKAQDAGADR